MDVKLSIVSGTYNRLPLLQRMVQSCRAAVGSVPYEIILVDGGSTDGTLAWAAAQPDVVLIAQGALLGAVKAFNAGARSARGEYVALLNDDIEVEGQSLSCAVEHLDCNQRVGQVAFYHRYRRRGSGDDPPYVQYYDGYVYGQCTVLRRWLGDEAGWWGDYHTYAGDTQLSMLIWQMGYEVAALKECCVTDYEHEDELRRHNNEQGGRREKQGGAHVDSTLFTQRWAGKMPARAKWASDFTPKLWPKARAGKLRTLRFKITPPGWIQRTGMIKAFAEYGPARQVNQSLITSKYGAAGLQDWAWNEVSSFAPDLVVLQSQSAESILPKTIYQLRDEFPETVFVNFNGDLRAPVPKMDCDVAKSVHCQLIVSPALFPEYLAAGARHVAFWPISYEPEYAAVARQWPLAPDAPDVIFLGNNYVTAPPESATRAELIRTLARSELRLELHGSGWDGIVEGVKQNMDKHAECARLYSCAKIAVSISCSAAYWGYSSDRLYCAMATGVPTLVQRFGGMAEQGLVDGQTCLTFSTPDEALTVARLWLKRPAELEAIGRAGRALMLAEHSWARRVKELLLLLDYGG